jgi:signal transduction histidine kinase/DNA-binding response OmpR family regulator
MTEAADPDHLRRELEYYKRELDALAGENLRLDYVISGLRHEVLQKRAGFALLSELQQKIGAHRQISAIFEMVVSAINAALGMERTIVLVPIRENVFRPSLWLGYREDEAGRLGALSIELPVALARGDETLLVHKSTQATPVIDALRTALEIPYFLVVPVRNDQGVLGLFVSGRLQESKPIYPPLDSGDVDTFTSIAALIAASVGTMRVALLEETDRLKSEFFANISHEFRTPITLTLGPLQQLLSGRAGPLPPEVREPLLVVQRNQERLLNLVNQILDLAKLEAGGARLEASLVPDANRLVQRRLAQFEPVARSRGVALQASLGGDVPGTDLYLDREKFDRLFTNLVSNAVKFTTAGSIDVSTRLAEGSFWLEVTDTGIGIKADQLPQIFDRFRQADGSESREYAGTGLGLALVKEIAQLHGGDVAVFSEYGRGSTFRVRLPLGRAHLDPASIVDDEDDGTDLPSAGHAVLLEGRADRQGTDELNRMAEAAFAADRPTVLYAEDNADLRRHVRDMLAEDCNVFVASDGEEGLRLARQYRPDLVITDQMMPRMSGRDLLRALRADDQLRDIPIVFLSARVGTEARIESLEAGADDYLSKPFHEGELRARVANLIEARRQARELADLNRRLEARVEEQMGEILRAGELLRFLPRAVAESVLEGRAQEEPLQRRKITVLCAAPEGMPALMDALEPEELAATINELLQELLATVVEQGGTVAQAGTDRLLVLFGAPRVMEVADQAEAAVRCALQMQQAVERLQTAWRRRGIAEAVRLRIAVNTGFCTIGMFGGEDLRSYTAVGVPVVAATHLQGEAAGGEILCALPTWVLLEPRVQGTARGPVALPGIGRPVEVYVVTGLEEAPRPAAGAQPADDRLVGTTLGRYRVVDRLGAGGMGEVYRARDTRLDRDVAIKFLSPHLAKDEAALRRFEREARAVAALKHPNIVVLHAFEREGDRPFIVMELIDGQTLDTALPPSGMDVSRVVETGVAIADALEAAHASGIAHRDLKLANVMLGRDGRVRVLDFGLARRIDGRAARLSDPETVTDGGLVMGTVGYTAPEVLQGVEPDARADLFSFGVMLYELATGRRPFAGASPGDVVAAILRDVPPPLTEARPDTPPALARLVARCLEKDPSRRHADTRDLLRELRMLAVSERT